MLYFQHGQHYKGQTVTCAEQHFQYLTDDKPLDELSLHLPHHTSFSCSWLLLFGVLMLCKSSASPRCVTKVAVWCFVNVDHTWKIWNKRTSMKDCICDGMFVKMKAGLLLFTRESNKDNREQHGVMLKNWARLVPKKSIL